jgi:hypothetical protein
MVLEISVLVHLVLLFLGCDEKEYHGGKQHSKASHFMATGKQRQEEVRDKIESTKACLQ